MKSFDVPVQYRSPLITKIKAERKAGDKLKKDLSPTRLEFGRLTVLLARHFGFCYGVENAIEIAFRAVAENPGRRIFLLSEMIHNPGVNADLLASGVRFLMDTKGNKLAEWDKLETGDIVIIPAFGTTVELEQELTAKGIEPARYETTCPFVEKVWNRAEKIGQQGYTIVVHGKPSHEETRATFSHSRSHTPTVVVKDMAQAGRLAGYITGLFPAEDFYREFEGQHSPEFRVGEDLKRIGVVNQTTMLAAETQGISDFLRGVILAHHSLDESTIQEHFADTRDTLCYATNDNQSAVYGMLQEPADLALVIGGYNSSNTSHLVELCEEKLPTYYIENAACIESAAVIQHFDMHAHTEVVTEDWLPQQEQVTVMITAGASCPDAVVEQAIERLNKFVNNRLATVMLQR